MRMYSDNAVQAADLETVKAQALLAVETIDMKQDRQLADLRKMLIGSFVVNLLVSAVLAVQLFDLVAAFK
jgi:cell division protein FtsL